ncbi:hypothetical protein DL766_004588 [Monosporascus sp. MC13-8B]|uniref:NADH dehydrogenase [ubiquinone] 1 alpha subcomplex assembly factor 3 n=1 Tax=Monosporascus cannonballus TaxID=155416 RepID=A0ABY0H140_9PEZI|nr:hypothetical protein DL762_006750 [Monosporascus cannonballus]RYO85118.1 hypothetical protein DL763_007222 [Monosporascus cannonballus]RYP31068.1 hypothetical protein DL766_004588 [Monosporascus sp. MC13-8B]
MATAMRIGRTLRPAPYILRQGAGCTSSGRLSTATGLSLTAIIRSRYQPVAPFHTTSHRLRRGEPPPTDFGELDVLGNTPVPSYSVDVCMSEGFQFNNGAKIPDGSGVIVVGGEAFAWRPWLPRGEKRLLNQKGQWEVPNETLGLFDLIWPRPGLGPDMRPISPQLRKYISSLGMRVEVLDTRNAASQFNLLATERGINNIAAALIPVGWREGVGAS